MTFRALTIAITLQKTTSEAVFVLFEHKPLSESIVCRSVRLKVGARCWEMFWFDLALLQQVYGTLSSQYWHILVQFLCA